jgi:hypothetical protein
MLLKLVLKDIKATWKTLLIWTLLCLAGSAFFMLIENSWKGYILIASGQISFIIGVYVAQEKGYGGEVLTCSLPVLRSSVVFSKYVTALAMAVGGIIIWIFNANLIHSVLPGTPDDFQLFAGNLFVPVIALFFIVFYISIFLPMVNVFNAVWVFMNVSIGCLMVITLAIILIHPSFNSYYSGSKSADLPYLIVVALIASTVLCVSIMLSQKLFNKRDLEGS